MHKSGTQEKGMKGMKTGEITGGRYVRLEENLDSRPKEAQYLEFK